MSKYLVRVHIKDEFYNKDEDRYEIELDETHLTFSKIFEIYLNDVASVFEHIHQFEKVLIEEV